jgi:prepilin-type N-terminal cleavage/methylation domain-containing protein
MKTHRRRHRQSGFTLVELMMVVLIIIILMSILVPLVAKVRIRAYAANSAAQVNQLRAACESYKQTFGQYPGPLPDTDSINGSPGGIFFNAPTRISGVTGTRITEAENLVLGLLGGLQVKNNAIIYSSTAVGTGPHNLNLNDPKQFQPLMDGWQNQLSGGRFADSRGTTTGDSTIPEFVDRFPIDPMPVLYLRARPGSTGVISNGGSPAATFFQYDLHQISPYTGTAINGKAQGLQAATGNSLGTAGKATIEGKVVTVYPAPLYFVDPSTNFAGTTNSTGTPRMKDSFILISPGPDRVYGTPDDITNFGAVAP